MTLDDLCQLLATQGQAQYGGESITQLAHALQTAALAEAAEAPLPLIAAALFHDIGHLAHGLGEMATQNGIDDHHEARGAGLLRQVFANAAIWQPVALHVQAKRWLVSAEPAYAAMLSEESHRSLALQGGTMNAAEAQAFLLKPHAQDAIALRRWDDLAKDPQAAPPPLSYWRQRLITA